MVTALTTNSTHRCSQTPTRPPSLRSDPDRAPPRRPKTREVSSRYLSLSTSSSSSNSSSSTNTASSIPSRRSQSPTVGRREAMSTTPLSSVRERAVSTERRRPATSAERMLTTSVRSLSVSFQGEPCPMPVNRVNQATTSLRKGTPEGRKAGVAPVRDQTENSKPSDQQHRWPGRLRGQGSNLLTQSLECGARRGNELKELKKRVVVIDEKTGNKGGKVDKLSIWVDHLVSSSPKSVLSKGTAKGNNEIKLRGSPNKIDVPARFGKEVINRGLKQLDPASPLSNTNTFSRKVPSKLIVAKKFQNDSPVSPSFKPGAKVASPSKALLTPSAGSLFRGLASPTRTKNGVGNMTKDNNTCCTPSMSGFAAVVRRGNLGENQIFDACDLRLLHNRHLQWRLVNARAEKALLAQKHAAKRNLYNSWVSTSKLRNSVMSKRAELQLLRHNLKLYIILKEQVLHLENWDITEKDHFNSLSGIIKALEASTVRLPIVNGARADVENVQGAISSAVDVMQSMASSTYPLLTKVEQTNSLVSDLSNLSVRERGLLDETRDFLSTAIIPFQVKYCSLKAHALQLQATL